LCLAGTLKALVALAAANGLYLVLLLLSGMVIPLDELPPPARAVARALPSEALTEVVRGTLTAGVAAPARAWAVLAVWALVGPLLATRLFRWE
jgi:ABC-2 type transport system permease protein